MQYVRGGKKKGKQVIPPGIEPGTLSVLDSRDNHYTMESAAVMLGLSVGFTTAVYTVVEQLLSFSWMNVTLFYTSSSFPSTAPLSPFPFSLSSPHFSPPFFPPSKAFKLEHPTSGRLVHAGVLEFTSPTSDAGYLPQWMMDHLQASEGR